MLTFQIKHLGETSSTNTLLLERAANNAPEGLVLVADSQTAGRGKPGRQWISPAGKNLLCSVLLRPPLSPAQAPMFTQIACRAVAQTLKSKYDIDAQLKRPNDVMFSGKKLCGILTEALSTATKLDAVVIGIGLNVNAKTSELPPEGISMFEITGKNYSLDEVLGFVLEELRVGVSEFYRKKA